MLGILGPFTDSHCIKGLDNTDTLYMKHYSALMSGLDREYKYRGIGAGRGWITCLRMPTGGIYHWGFEPKTFKQGINHPEITNIETDKSYPMMPPFFAKGKDNRILNGLVLKSVFIFQTLQHIKKKSTTVWFRKVSMKKSTLIWKGKRWLTLMEANPDVGYSISPIISQSEIWSFRETHPD